MPTSDENAKPVSAPALSAKARRYLRGLAQREKAVVFVGDAGLSAGVLRSLDEALGARELVKIKLHAPEDKKQLAAQLALQSQSALCGLIGHTVILYRPHRDPDARQIEVPT